MATMVYRPDHGMANERGMVETCHLCDDGKYGESAYVVSDTMEPTRHMATGRMHTSKSEFRRDTRRSGCIEVGNETGYLNKPRTPVKLSRKDRVEHIKHAIRQLQSR
jgi:hypothetical protein